MIAQQTDIPIFPIEIQGIFLLGYVDKELAEAVFNDDNNGIVFYFHPYDEGSLINQQVIEKYLYDNKIDIKLSSIKTQNYLEYLSFIFNLRILAIKQKKSDDFSLRYSKKVGVLLNGK
jgi:hypothetical protein